MIVVEPGNPHDPQATALLRASHALMQQMFPPEDNYFLSIDDLCQPGIHFFIARRGATTLGTGALAVKPGYGEVKSMFVADTARGQGVAGAILRRIEDEACALGLPLLRLETGDGLAAAHRLYARHGFVRCGIFGDYLQNGSSLFMEKPLG
jgi:putative acetyltransferase